ncbi:MULTISPECIES: fatty acid metabolism transcriptional regulator FadR [Bacillus subtilis group]|uniref:Fatty acid metabolism transcriptional regulator FadR n=1 Tax=Bacillus mojavensis TaxID=72360 RepID=A0AAP3CQ70_BACMO|nr:MULTISPECIES: fatty acid metabolism transcriptional regulator FadR [Bacillus subtilis group]MCM3157567.1 fatty acid metabolism transcriptional regulator FadR [Bacillus subtilis]MCY8106421.1 fatty acid metabolism transcriptional regulator FadR [Bacillus mojavensis]MCY8482741.1 fatty acid metabolism transcriptional regulator FadR [Bacillus mojavensis]MCY8508999.1 fatty acid metabolism transcriptional regulator FadR [Bacillus mojavensis]MCY8929620.1 fatty acid metabolism transcriptional regula
MKQKRPKYMQIIDAAVEVIAENGYHQSQVSKIAKQAGVADGTIYLYFKNKEDILISLFKEKMGQFIERMEEDIKEKATAKEKLALVISKHFSLLAGDHNLAIVTQLELRQSNLELRQKINEILKGYLNILDSILTEGIQSGELKEGLDVRLARQMIFGTIDETVTTWVMNDQKYDLAALSDSVLELLVSGIHNK